MGRWFIALLAVLVLPDEGSEEPERAPIEEPPAAERVGSEAFVAWLGALRAIDPPREDPAGRPHRESPPRKLTSR